MILFSLAVDLELNFRGTILYNELQPHNVVIDFHSKYFFSCCLLYQNHIWCSSVGPSTFNLRLGSILSLSSISLPVQAYILGWSFVKTRFQTPSSTFLSAASVTSISWLNCKELRLERLHPCPVQN